MTSFSVDVPGEARSQGSARWVTSASTGRIIGVKSRHERAYRESVVAHLRAAWGPRPRIPRHVAVGVRLDAAYPRPRAHYTTVNGGPGELKGTSPGAPDEYAAKTRTPDLDKIVRLYLDAMTIAGVVTDDAQVAWVRASKFWLPIDNPASTHLSVSTPDWRSHVDPA